MKYTVLETVTLAREYHVEADNEKDAENIIDHEEAVFTREETIDRIYEVIED